MWSSEGIKHNLDTTSKLNTREEVPSQELSMKDRKRDKESVSIGGFLPHKDPLCFIEGPSVFIRSRRPRRDLGAEELGQSYCQPKQGMEIMKNYSTRPSAIPFLTSIPAKNPWEVLQASGMVHKVHPSAEAVPADQIFWSLGTSLETFKGESLTIKEDGGVKSDDAGVQSYLWDIWVMEVYPLMLPHKVKGSFEGCACSVSGGGKVR